MLLNLGNSVSIYILFLLLSPLLVVVRNIPGVQNVVLDRVLVLSQCLQMMRSDEPFAIAVLLLRHLLVDVPLIVIGGQV